MNNKNSEILNSIKNNLKAQFNPIIKDIILFGSRIGENYNPDSDYDILIVLNKTADWKLKTQIYDSLYEINLKYGILLDVHIISENEINNSTRFYQPIFQDIFINGIRL